MGIRSYGISVTTLEDVFLRVRRYSTADIQFCAEPFCLGEQCCIFEWRRYIDCKWSSRANCLKLGKISNGPLVFVDVTQSSQLIVVVSGSAINHLAIQGHDHQASFIFTSQRPHCFCSSDFTNGQNLSYSCMLFDCHFFCLALCYGSAAGLQVRKVGNHVATLEIAQANVWSIHCMPVLS